MQKYKKHGFKNKDKALIPKPQNVWSISEVAKRKEKPFGSAATLHFPHAQSYSHMQLLPPLGCCAAVNKPVLYIWHDFHLPLAIYSFYNLPCYRSSVANCCFLGICSPLDIWCRITGQNGRGAQRILQPKFIICLVPGLTLLCAQQEPKLPVRR